MRIRSLPQNSYYWSVVLPDASAGISAAKGHRYTVDRLHEIFKRAYIPQERIDPDTGEVLFRTTTNLGTIEFIAYTDRIKAYCDTIGVVIREPDPLHWMRREESMTTVF